MRFLLFITCEILWIKFIITIYNSVQYCAHMLRELRRFHYFSDSIFSYLIFYLQFAVELCRFKQLINLPFV